MSDLRIFLFGKFHVLSSHQPLVGLEAGKVQELLCYLLVHRDRPHPREPLAGHLWGDTTTAQSKAYLRKALWQLQDALNHQIEFSNGGLFQVDPNWIRLNPETDFWLDVAVFEQAFTHVQAMAGKELDDQRVQTLQTAVDLYRGDLLEGWYQDWCLFERERLQSMYLAMLDKLMDYCESNHDYEAALVHGSVILRYDRARECTHRRLMRLHYLAGDRTAALRQYERCVAALDEELDVIPAESTTSLYEQIRADQLNISALAMREVPIRPMVATNQLEVLDRLRQLQVALVGLQNRVEETIKAVERNFS